MKLSRSSHGIHPDIEERLKRWKEQSIVVREIGEKFKRAEALHKSLFARMYNAEKANGGSIEDVKNRVYASQEWMDLAASLAELEVEYDFQKTDLAIREAAYYGMKDTFKHEAPVDRRGA